MGAGLWRSRYTQGSPGVELLIMGLCTWRLMGLSYYLMTVLISLIIIPLAGLR